MTENTDHAAESQRNRALYESQVRLNGTLINDMMAMREANADMARQIKAITDRLNLEGTFAAGKAELLKIWGERLAWLEDVVISHIRDREARVEVRQEAQPLRTASARLIAGIERTADRLDAPLPGPLLP